MAKEKNPDNKKKKSEEVTDYESLLDDFTTIFNDSGDSNVDHDGLALSELLGEDVTMTAKPVEAEESESGSEEELSDFTKELEGLDLEEFTESDDAGESAEEEEITIEDSTDETLTIEHGIDELTNIYGGGDLIVEEPEVEAAAVDYSAVTREIEAFGFDDVSESVTPGEAMKEEEPAVAGSADTDELEDLDFGEISDFDLTVEEPEEKVAAVDDSAVTQEIEALGFDDLDETVTPDEAVMEEAYTAVESDDTRKPEVLDFESIAGLDVSAEEVQEEEDLSIDHGMEDTSIDTIVEEPVGYSAADIILDEELTDSDSGYASILDQLNGGKAEKEETFDVSDVKALDIREDDDTGELSFMDSKQPEEESTEVETSEDSVFMDLDLDLEDEEEEFIAEEESAVSVASPDAGEDDFLGLSGISSKGGGTAGRVDSATEVLFEGVEMNFDEQIALVTHAEILLAQKKTVEATELFRRVAKGKGETHWVAKRLRTYGAQVHKTDSSE